MHVRLEKLTKIRALSVDPFPHSFPRSHTVAQLYESFETLESHSDQVTVAGRLMSLRLMGKAAFADLMDDGEQIQIYIKRDAVGELGWKLFNLLDLGDIVGVQGNLFKTHTGEKSIHIAQLTLLTKNLRPLPAVKEKEGEVWNRWADAEERYRHRTVDLIVNRDSRRVALQRSRIVREIRAFLDSRNFVEVETPIFQPIYGGAAARPFTTHHHALDCDLYLRIADELYLKRLIAGGLPRVYEISKDFRNEGLDRLHAPEFTMMEFYAAYEDYNYCIALLEELLPHLAQILTGGMSIKWDGHSIDMTPPFQRATMANLIRDACGIEIVNRNAAELANEITSLGMVIDPNWGAGKLIDELFSLRVQPNLINPTFVIDYPVELSPLAKRNRNDPHLVERFELFVGGLEMANAFSELNDPLDQRMRFEEQARQRAGDNDEIPPIDEDFLEALEIGMPPTAGLGMGIDRLTMLLTGCSSIRDVILFPILRPKPQD